MTKKDEMGTILQILNDMPEDQRFITVLLKHKDFPVSAGTFYNWMREYPEFKQEVNSLITGDKRHYPVKGPTNRYRAFTGWRPMGRKFDKFDTNRPPGGGVVPELKPDGEVFIPTVVMTSQGPVSLKGMTLGERVATLRVMEEFVVRDLGLKAGVAGGYLSEIEHNKKVPPLDTIYDLAKALNVDYQIITEGYRHSVDKDGVKRSGNRKPSKGSITVGLLIGFGLLAGLIALSKKEH